LRLCDESEVNLLIANARRMLATLFEAAARSEIILGFFYSENYFGLKLSHGCNAKNCVSLHAAMPHDRLGWIASSERFPSH
jgi:hypothetical protein